MILTKKQVKAALDILKINPKGNPRRNSGVVTHDGKTYLAITSAYVGIYLEIDDLEIERNMGIPFTKIEEWYKSANAKDRIDTEWIRSNMVDDVIAPTVSVISTIINADYGSIDSICVDPKYLSYLADVVGESVELKFTSKFNLVGISYQREYGNNYIGFIMPIKRA